VTLLAMTKSEREAFLADLHVGVISIEREDAPPLSAPIWYDYSPPIGLWIITGAESLKGRLLQKAGRSTLVAQVEEPPNYQYVRVEGPIIETRTPDVERDRKPLARRYFGTELGDLYVSSNVGADLLLFVMRPERWRTVDYRKNLPAS
jgi:nitroimidazol reductase NimA-like FMN-containing flavoprotein (pyridoxamine 5'-phosphate oxidase superfamily)